MTSINPASFIGGHYGEWKVTRFETIVGNPLLPVEYVQMRPTHILSENAKWILRGTNNHTRYSERKEVDAMKARQEGLGRNEATCAALIPIRKSAAWWDMAQDERRKIFEAESQHIAMSMEYLPAIARRLYHSRDLGEPFDFLTWFEFAPANEHLFDALVKKLRASREWEFVDQEIDIRLIKHTS